MEQFPSLGWRYAIRQAIGSGGTATVYRAVDRLQGREVAVKFARIEARAGIKQEFVRLFRLRHDCIVKVYEYHRSGDGEFFTMELYLGGTISEAYRNLDTKAKTTSFLDVWAALARTLSYLHQRGVVHGDLKPGNILWENGSVKLLDLGLSQRGRHQDGNVFTGTPAYAAPELVSGDEGPSVASDIYSLGLLLFELLTGRLPEYNDRMSANSNWNTAVRELLPPEVAELLISMLQYEALDRPASAMQLLQALKGTGKIDSAERSVDFHFTGRGQVLGDLRHALSAGKANDIAILGPAGCGKTRLLQEANFITQLAGLESHFAPAAIDDLDIVPEIPNGTVLFIDDLTPENSRRLSPQAQEVKLRLVTAAREAAAASANGKTIIRLQSLNAGDLLHILTDLFPGMINYSSVLLGRHLESLTGGNLHFARLLLNHWLDRSLITSSRNAWIVDWTRLYDDDILPEAIEKEFAGQWDPLDEGSRNAMLKQALLGGVQSNTASSYWTDDNGEVRSGLMAEYSISRYLSDNPAWLKNLLQGNDPVPVPGRHAAWKAQASLGLDQQWAGTGKTLFAMSLETKNIEAAIYYGRKLADAQALPMDERLLYVDKTVELYERLGRTKLAIDLLSSFEEQLTWHHHKTMAMLFIPNVENDSIIRAIEAGIRKLSPEDIVAGHQAGIWKGWAMALRGNRAAGEALIRDELGRASEGAAHESDSAYGYYFLAEIARMQNDVNKTGIELYRSAIDHGKQSLRPSLLSSFYKRTGDLCRTQGKIDEALAMYTASATIIDDGLPFIGQFIAHGRIAECHYSSDKYALAAESLEKAWSLKITADDSRWDAYLLAMQANVDCGRGHFQQAISAYETVARAFKEMNQVENYFAILINMVRVEKCLGRFAQACHLVLKGLEIARQHRLENLEIVALQNMGCLESDRQEYSKSNAFFHQIEAILERSDSAIDFDVIFYGTINALFLDDPTERSHWEPLLVKYPPSTTVEKFQAQFLQGLKLIHDGKTAEGLFLAVSVSDQTKDIGQPFNYAKYCLIAGELALRNGQPGDLPAIIQCLINAAREFEQLGTPGFLARAKEQITTASIWLAQSPAVYLSHPMLNGLYQLCSSLGAHDETEAVAGKALALVMDLLGAERGGIFLKDRHGELALAAQVNLDADTSRDAYDYSRRSIARVLEGQDVIYSNDTELDEAFKSSLSVQTNKIHSLLCAPIVFREGALGAVYLDSRLRTNLFDPAQRTFLKAIVDIMGAVLEGGQLLARLEEENRALRSRSAPSLDAIIWQSPEMGLMLERLQKAAPVDIAVLIEGESGTGKELLARAIHELSPRKDKPYLALDCGALAETLLESELFGHAKGAFTDAKADKPGLFEAAAGGTVFLDEIANASKAVQARLLRVLEAREVRRIGESKSRKVDVRLICAASINLEEEIKHGRFRRDLFFRIKEMKLVVPPLRERGRDVNLLAEHFKTVYAQQFGKTGLRFTPEARKVLLSYPWPGNVRELENAVKTAVVLSGGKAITPACLELPEDISIVTGHQSLKDIMNRQEKAAIEKALQQNGYNVTATAKILKLTRQGLQKKMKQLEIG